MNWSRPDKYFQYDESGYYSVTKTVTGYHSWRTKHHPKGRQLIAVQHPTADAARAACEQDSMHIEQEVPT